MNIHEVIVTASRRICLL